MSTVQNPQKKSSYFKIGDIGIILMVIAIIVGVSWNTYAKGTGEPTLKVTTEKGVYLYPMSEYGTYSFPGPLGDTIIKISKEGADVLDSPCPDKLCVQSPPLTSPGMWNACLPNVIFLTIIANDNVEDMETLDEISF